MNQASRKRNVTGQDMPDGWVFWIESGQRTLLAGNPQQACDDFHKALSLGYAELDAAARLSEPALLAVVAPLLNLVDAYLEAGRAEMALVKLSRCTELVARQWSQATTVDQRLQVQSARDLLLLEWPQLERRMCRLRPHFAAFFSAQVWH
ncbi:MULTISPECIES: hypothetical protein [unclassified Oceanobacter]|uniref:hypothetical protein n=2 Tax=Gammaproteobacteria TaxID=1236 RepID=UPI002733263A|nr:MULTISPECIES: hypothetical protein [unclassified Oceanobacter]MDP2609918.1 hypothetical protein [Oceanobacter sp. 1_MG-2023]MDP2613200.1 hypothetical protein [Oceanobacter sp. 2_MG-2023]